MDRKTKGLEDRGTGILMEWKTGPEDWWIGRLWTGRQRWRKIEGRTGSGSIGRRRDIKTENLVERGTGTE
jgi:hypothetical protein